MSFILGLTRKETAVLGQVETLLLGHGYGLCEMLISERFTMGPVVHVHALYFPCDFPFFVNKNVNLHVLSLSNLFPDK